MIALSYKNRHCRTILSSVKNGIYDKGVKAKDAGEKQIYDIKDLNSRLYFFNETMKCA